MGKIQLSYVISWEFIWMRNVFWSKQLRNWIQKFIKMIHFETIQNFTLERLQNCAASKVPKAITIADAKRKLNVEQWTSFRGLLSSLEWLGRIMKDQVEDGGTFSFLKLHKWMQSKSRFVKRQPRFRQLECFPHFLSRFQLFLHFLLSNLNGNFIRIESPYLVGVFP